jgi:four helix bundle protein
MSSYKDLEIWQRTRALVVEIHKMTLTELPKFEMFEERSQIRRAIKSVKSNLVEGYGHRVYKQEFIKFLTYAFVSCCETIDHLETLFETESLKKMELSNEIHLRLDTLGKKLNLLYKRLSANTKFKFNPDKWRSNIQHPIFNIY